MFISTAWSRSEPHCTQRTLSYGDLLKGILSFKTHQPDAVNHSRRLLLCCLWALTVRSKSKVKQRNKRVTMYKRWKTRQIMGKWCVFFFFVVESGTNKCLRACIALEAFAFRIHYTRIAAAPDVALLQRVCWWKSKYTMRKKNPQIHCLIPHGVWLPSIKDVVKKLPALSFWFNIKLRGHGSRRIPRCTSTFAL